MPQRNGTHRNEAGDKKLAERLKSLDERLRDEQKTRVEEDRPRPDNAGFAQAMRLSTEFIVSILVGAFIGWLIDRVAGIAPWGMIFFLLLGFAAGVMSVMRSAGVIADPRAQWNEGSDNSAIAPHKNSMDNADNSAKNMPSKRQ